MARVRPSGAAGHAFAAGLNRDPRRADHRLAPATLLSRRRQAADDDHPSCGGREYPGRRMGVHRPVDDSRDWFGDLRLEVVAKSCAPGSNNTATRPAARVVTRNCCLTARGIPNSHSSGTGGEPAFDLVRTRLGPMRDFVERADHRPEVVETPELFACLRGWGCRAPAWRH